MNGMWISASVMTVNMPTEIVSMRGIAYFMKAKERNKPLIDLRFYINVAQLMYPRPRKRLVTGWGERLEIISVDSGEGK